MRLIAPDSIAALRVLTLAVTRAALLAVFVIAVQGVPANAAFPGANGKVAFISAACGGCPLDVYTVNPDGSGRVPITSDAAADLYPTWSPDGNRIAWASNRGGSGYEIYVMTAAGGNVQQLTNQPGDEHQPTWSPDGTRIAFIRGNQIWTMGADGSTPVQATTLSTIPGAVSYSDPAWSPDGTEIAFRVVYENPHLGGGVYAMHPDGTGARYIACDVSRCPGVTAGDCTINGCIGTQSGFDWSPDGQRLVFMLDDDSVPEAHVIRVSRDGSEQIDIGPAATAVGNPVWSPDGTRIASVDPSGSGIRTTDSSGGDSQPIPNSIGSAPSWQPILKGYPRPKSATPLFLPLVPAYAACDAGSATKTHAPPLAYGSCTAAQASDQLTVGSFDANGKAANSTGYLRMVRLGDLTTPADDSDLRLVSDITDVRNQGDLSDYTGELQAKLDLRITDKLNTPYPGGPGPGTVGDTPFAFTIPCAPTTDTTIGSQCSLDTTADTVLPGIAPENRRAIWQTDQVKVYDGGPDGDADTAPNTLFMVQGVFAP